MKIETKFDLLEMVNIKGIDVVGRVVKIEIVTNNAIYYEIEYWFNCVLKSVWLYDLDLQKV